MSALMNKQSMGVRPTRASRSARVTVRALLPIGVCHDAPLLLLLGLFGAVLLGRHETVNSRIRGLGAINLSISASLVS